MATKKSLGETVLGWFVVREDEDENDEKDDAKELMAKLEKKHGAPPPAPPAPGKAATRAAAGAPAKAAAAVAATAVSPLPVSPARPAVPLNEGQLPPPVAGVAPDAKVFTQVYRAAEISEGEQERVEKALNLVQSLPAETPREIKKQIVEASLKAFGIPVDQIIEAGVQEIQALDAYIKHGERHTQDVLTDASARVAKLEAEIGEVRRLMELQVETQLTLTRASNGEKLRVQAVLEFFGQEAVARVVQASPKLVEPR